MYSFILYEKALRKNELEDRAKGIQDEIGKEATLAPADFENDEYGAKVRAKLSEGMTLHRQADSDQRILTEVLNKRKLSRIQKKPYKKDYGKGKKYG